KMLAVVGGWEAVFRVPARERLEELVPDYLKPQRWFAGKARRIRTTTIDDLIPLPVPGSPVYLMILGVEYVEGDAEHYLLPLTYLAGEPAARLLEEDPHAVLARVVVDG